MIPRMARIKPLEEDEPLKFARAILDTIIAKHDPEASREEGKNPAASLWASAVELKAVTQGLRTSQQRNAVR